VRSSFPAAAETRPGRPVGGFCRWPQQTRASCDTATVAEADRIASGETPAGVRRMLADAAQRGLAVELRRRPVAHSLEEAAELLGIGPSDIAKTIVVRRSSGNYLFAVIPGGTQISWPKLRMLLGVSKMKLPDAAEALEVTRYERGTITAIGSEPSWPVIIDQRLLGRRAALGAGGHGYSAFVEIDDLVRAYDATVADIVIE
jgi:Cys-tRNA(Pro)/Cys-tRNA(Cys) deacylase